MLQKIIGQFTRDERLYDDEKIKNLAKRFPSENSPDGQRMIMYMLLFSWYTRNTVLPFTADQIVSLVDSIIDVYYNQEYQQMNNIMISLIRNDLQRMSFWSNEYVFKTFFNDDFITDADGRMYVNLEKLSIFNKWILQNQHNVEFYNYSHLLVQKCKHNNKHLQYVHNYTIMVSDDVPQNVVQIHCPKCDMISQISKDDFLKMCREYEKSSAKFSQGISIYCHKCDTQINFIRLYGNFKVLYGGDGFQPYEGEEQEEQEEEYQEPSEDIVIQCDDVNDNKLQINIKEKQDKINNGKEAEWHSLQTTFEQFGAVVKNNDKNWTYQKAQEWYKKYLDDVSGRLIVDENEYFIRNPQENQINDPGLKEIFKYFANQQVQHMDMAYYSGQKFTDNIEQEVKDLINGNKILNNDDDVIQELQKLKQCLQLVQNLLNQYYLRLNSDGINGDKLENSNYKLLKLFPNRSNGFYQTIYFVAYLQKKLDEYKEQNNNGQNTTQVFKIPRESIQYISLCHGGIVIKIPFNNASNILWKMLNTINSLLKQQRTNIIMKRLVIFIVIMSKYEKAAYDNLKASKPTLRDDFNCVINKNDKSGQSHSFYNTFMQLYYGMLLWDGRDVGSIKVDTFYDNHNIIEILKRTFIEFYKKLKHGNNGVNNKLLVFDAENELNEKPPLNDKYLSFLMTLYTYNCYIKSIFSHVYNIPNKTLEEIQKRKKCYCLIKWIQNFVLYMLMKVYGYKKENLQKVRITFLVKTRIAQNCYINDMLLKRLKNRKIE